MVTYPQCLPNADLSRQAPTRGSRAWDPLRNRRVFLSTFAVFPGSGSSRPITRFHSRHSRLFSPATPPLLRRGPRRSRARAHIRASERSLRRFSTRSSSDVARRLLRAMRRRSSPLKSRSPLSRAHELVSSPPPPPHSPHPPPPPPPPRPPATT